MSNREGKEFCHTEADDRIAREATSHSILGADYFHGRICQEIAAE
jgi:hypothetical protein